MSSFATIAVRTPDAVPAMPTAPVAAKYHQLTLSCTTTPVAATRVEAWSGWRHTVRSSGEFAPFRRAVDDLGHCGMVAVGLEVPESVTGSTVSIHLVIDSAAPCGSAAPLTAHWQWWDGTTWQALAVSDGTHGLREAGLVRFVAPQGWATGCSDVTASSGRWIRFVTDQPRRIGVVRDVITDAVVAEFVSRAADPQLDPSPATALPPGTIKDIAHLRPGRHQGHQRRVGARWRARGRPGLRDEGFGPGAAPRARPHPVGLRADGIGLPGSPCCAACRTPTPTATGRPARSGSSSCRTGPGLHSRGRASASPVASSTRCGRSCRSPPRSRSSARRTSPSPSGPPVRLRRGVAALQGRAAVGAALESLLHPTLTAEPRWGLSLYASTVVAVLKRLTVVDVVRTFDLRAQLPSGPSPVEVVEVDPCRGLYCSAGTRDRL